MRSHCSGEGAGGDEEPEGPGRSGGLAAAVAGLATLIDELQTLDFATLDGAEVGEALVALHAQQQRLAAATAHLTRQFEVSGAWADSGLRSAKGWLAHRCRVSKSDARNQVLLGRDLEAMPEADAALGAGDVSVSHVRRLGALRANERMRDAFEDAEQELVDWARSMCWPEFTQALAYWAQAADPDGAEEKAKDVEEARRVHLSRGLDGTGLLDGELTPLAHETFGNGLERIEDELFQADWNEAREQLGRDPAPGELPRTPVQRRHDALVEMAIRAHTAPADGKRPEPLITVLAGLESLERVCELDSGQVLAPGSLVPLLDRALIERIVFDAPSRVVDIGQTRTFRGALRRAIKARDRECQWPGCHVPAKWCQVDHIQPHATGGETSLDNGRLLCGWHNRLRNTGREPPAA